MPAVSSMNWWPPPGATSIRRASAGRRSMSALAAGGRPRVHLGTVAFVANGGVGAVDEGADLRVAHQPVAVGVGRAIETGTYLLTEDARLVRRPLVALARRRRRQQQPDVAPFRQRSQLARTRPWAGACPRGRGPSPGNTSGRHRRSRAFRRPRSRQSRAARDRRRRAPRPPARCCRCRRRTRPWPA